MIPITSWKRPRALASLTISLLACAQPAAAHRHAVPAENGMVVSVHFLASEAGVEILRKGGNAVDAAIATGFALAAVYPSAGNIAGGGFMLIHLREENRQTAIDYREAAPGAAIRDMFLDAGGRVLTDERSARIGWRASGVPGTVAGFALAFETYSSGKVSWADLIEPARRLAAGHELTHGAANSMRQAGSRLGRFAESKRVYLKDGEGWKAGEIWPQPDLAATLGRIQREGPREFYEGETARLIATAMEENGGLITLDDLRSYRAIERKPLRFEYRGHLLVCPPPPCSGGVTLFQMLGMLEPFDVASLGHHSAAKLHLFHEVMRRAFRDRIEYLGDPAFVSNPVERMLARDYLAKRMADFDPARATPSEGLEAGLGPRESLETTHYSIVDAAGNAVSNTYTIRNAYGSAVTIPGAGLLMNNVMDDLAAKVGEPNQSGLMQGPANEIAPGKRPLSSMTPTIVLKDGRLRLITGSPGGPTIINTVLQVVTNVIDFEMPVPQAVNAPRVTHHWLPDTLSYERWGLSRDTVEKLEAMGHRPVESSGSQGEAETILIDPASGLRLGAADPRLPDTRAIGY